MTAPRCRVCGAEVTPESTIGLCAEHWAAHERDAPRCAICGGEATPESLGTFCAEHWAGYNEAVFRAQLADQRRARFHVVDSPEDDPPPMAA